MLLFYRCVCSWGYTGDDCSLYTLGQHNEGMWHNISCENCGLIPRAAHAGVFLPDTNCLWIFGGYTLNSVLGDLVVYNFSQSRWLTVTPVGISPDGRRGHAMQRLGNNFVMYGGVKVGGLYSDELWLYNVSENSWHLRGGVGDVNPPGLSGHTLTVVKSEWIYLFGGIESDESFSPQMFRINLQHGNTWERVTYRNSKSALHRVVGHSAVYHPETKSIMIYGGFVHHKHFARFGQRVSQLWAFHVEENFWSELDSGINKIPYSRVGYRVPDPGAYHTANIIGTSIFYNTINK